MIERYDNEEYVPILKDIRREILNISKSFVFNSPNYSKVAFNRDIQGSLSKSHNFLKAFTYKLQTIIKHKFDKLNRDMLYSPPWEHNMSFDRYMLY
jgi:hypothetical protein